MPLQNLVALITGGAQGLGKGFARAVLEGGGKVSLLDIKEDVGRKTAEEFKSKYGHNSTLFVKCNVLSQQEVEDAFELANKEFGKLDLVVNNAGTASLNANWQRTIDINLTAVMRCCLLAGKYMGRDKRGGHIINVASAAGLFSVPYDPAYSASKYGVVGLSRSLSETFEPKSIRVNCLCPAYVDTELLRQGLASNIPSFTASVEKIGIMSVDDVVAQFKKLLEEKDATGGVLLVTPKLTTYQFPSRSLKGASKL